MGKGGQIQVQVAWFYRPEEAMGGRKVKPMHPQSHVLHAKPGPVARLSIWISRGACKHLYEST